MSARLCSLGVKHTDKLQGNVCRWCSESFQRAGGKPCQPGESTLFIRYHPKAPKSSWLEALWGQWTVECSTICYAQLSISWLPGQCLPSSIFELWSCREGGLQQGRPVLHRDWKKIESVDRVNEHLLVFNHQTCLNTFTFFWVHATNILCRSFIDLRVVWSQDMSTAEKVSVSFSPPRCISVGSTVNGAFNPSRKLSFLFRSIGGCHFLCPLDTSGKRGRKNVWKGATGLYVAYYSPNRFTYGFYLRKKETGHAGGRAVLCWARIWLCWARWAGLGADLALLSVGWGRAGRAAWGLALVGGRGVWPCWVRWVGLGVGFGSGGRAGPLFSTLDSTAIVLIKRL